MTQPTASGTPAGTAATDSGGTGDGGATTTATPSSPPAATGTTVPASNTSSTPATVTVTAGAGTDGSSGQGAATPPPDQSTTGTGQPQAGGGSGAGDYAKKPLSEFPPELQNYIGGLRKENGDNRVTAKTATKQAADLQGKLDGFLEGFAKVLGLQQDDPAAQLTPEQLTEQLTDARDSHRKTQVELATFRRALKAEADADALLDSREFTDKIHALDPAADDFASRVDQLITEAVEANPARFKAAGQVPAAQTPPSGGVFAGGPGGPADPASMSVEDHLRVIDPVGASR